MKLVISDSTVEEIFEEKRHLTPFQEETLTLALKKLFKQSSHFNICDIDNMVSLLDIVPDGKIYKELRVLHCVDYSSMSREYIRELKTKVFQLLDIDTSVLSRQAKAITNEIIEVVEVKPERRFMGIFKSAQK